MNVHCLHCDVPIRSTTDPGVPWVHEGSANGYCDVPTSADAVLLAGRPDRTEAEPNVERLAAEALDALSDDYELLWFDHQDQLTDVQIQSLLDEGPIDDAAWSHLDEIAAEQRHEQVERELSELLGEDARTALDDAGELDYLRDEIRCRDRSDAVRMLMSSTGHRLFRYDLDLDVPATECDSEAVDDAVLDIAEHLGLDLDHHFDRLTELVANASYGGRLVVAWYGDIDEAVHLAHPSGRHASAPQNVTFSGSPYLLIWDGWNGSGHDVRIDSITASWRPYAVRLDSPKVDRYCWDSIAGVSAHAYAAEIDFTYSASLAA